MVVSGVSNMHDVYLELLNYAPQYFTSVTEDSSGNITCLDDDKTPLYLHKNSDNSILASLSTIYGTALSDNQNFSIAITQIIRTSYGIILYGSDNYYVSDPSYHMPIFIITKDNADKTVIFSTLASKTNYKLEGSAAPVHKVRTRSSSTDTDLLTSVVPMVVEGSTNYTPNLKWVVQKQYTISGDIVLGTTHYWSDGFVALKDI